MNAAEQKIQTKQLSAGIISLRFLMLSCQAQQRLDTATGRGRSRVAQCLLFAAKKLIHVTS